MKWTVCLWMLSVMTILLLVGCSQQKSEEDDGAVAKPETGAEKTPTKIAEIEGYQDWKMVFGPAVSEEHANTVVKTYADEVAAAVIGNPADFPSGARLVKEGYANNSGQPGDLQKIWVMMKKDPGYDDAGGNWYYATLDAEGNVENEGDSAAMSMCAGCHAHAKNDHVFAGSEHTHDHAD